MPQKMVLVLLVKNNQLYLGKKKHKIGKGKLNAPGGKMEAEDRGSFVLTAVRELWQECGIRVPSEDLHEVALLHIDREGVGYEFEIRVYMVRGFQGDPGETEEIGQLEPYAFASINYDALMPADELWLPAVLFGLSIEAYITYNEDRSVVTSFRVFPLSCV